jgi:hypothetical protein
VVSRFVCGGCSAEAGSDLFDTDRLFREVPKKLTWKGNIFVGVRKKRSSATIPR